MQCDNCGQEIRRYKGGDQKGEYMVTEFFGFNFCESLYGTCLNGFTIKLYQAAQASKEAKQKAASEAHEASVNTAAMVEGVPRDWKAT